MKYYNSPVSIFTSKNKHIHPRVFPSFGNVSTKYGDKTIVQGTLKKISHAFRISTDHIIQIDQHHGSQIIAIANPLTPKRKDEKADGVISNIPGYFLLIKTADCIPLSLADPVKKVIGLIHVGWRGAEAKIHTQAIKIMQKQFGCQVKDIIIGIGPSICANCYTFPQPPQQTESRRWKTYIYKLHKKWHVDLKGLVTAELIEAGINKFILEDTNICTYENQRFFSHRRSKQTGEKEGRFASVIGLKENNE